MLPCQQTAKNKYWKSTKKTFITKKNKAEQKYGYYKNITKLLKPKLNLK